MDVTHLTIVTLAIILYLPFVPQPARTASVTTQRPSLSCYVCNSGLKFINFNCRGSNNIVKKKAINETCRGRCVTRTSKFHHKTAVFRGCTDPFPLPTPFPPDGCYLYKNDTVCICGTSLCNYVAMGDPKGRNYVDHVTKSEIKKGGGSSSGWSYKGVRAKPIIKCHECNSGSRKTPNVNCPGDDVINGATTFKSNCSEMCFARTTFLNPGVVYRGCTAVFPSLPRPFPENGCYKYYREVWCICNYGLCNNGPLGDPSDTELDDHLMTTPIIGSSPLHRVSTNALITIMFLTNAIISFMLRE